MKSKSLKVLSLVLLASGLAGGAAYAKGGGGGGMGMGGGMGNGSMTSPDAAQRDQTRTQERIQKSVQKRDGSNADGAQRNEKEIRHENREQIRSEGASSAGQ